MPASCSSLSPGRRSSGPANPVQLLELAPSWRLQSAPAFSPLGLHINLGATLHLKVWCSYSRQVKAQPRSTINRSFTHRNQTSPDGSLSCSVVTNTLKTLNMPPRLLPRLYQPVQTITNSITASSSIPSFLLPFLHLQSRNASILGSLSDRPGAYNRKIRRGRGPSSGKGGKSGRGSDGQKQHGGVPAGFNGGQTPEHIVHGKYGFKNL